MRKTQLNSGQRFGRLVTVEEVEAPRPGCHWRCRCDCGNEIVTRASNLIAANTESCGCLRREVTGRRNLRHGHTAGGRHNESPEFRAWLRAKARCTNPNEQYYADYGGRGIRMAEEWLEDFPAFFRHVGRRPSAKHSLDRVDVNGHYAPGNVRWATTAQQSRNRRDNVWVDYDDQRLVLQDFADLMGVPDNALRIRMRYHGVSAYQALGMIRRTGLRARN